MTARRARVTGGVLAVATLLVAVTPVAGQDAAPAASASRLDVSIRARALGLTPERVSGAVDLGLEPMRAPTGEGVSRWPKDPAGSSGFYLSTVGCYNDWPPRSRRASRSREALRSQAAPARPAPGTR